MTQGRAHHVLSWPSDWRVSRDSHGIPLTRARPKRGKVLPLWVVGRDMISPQIGSATLSCSVVDCSPALPFSESSTRCASYLRNPLSQVLQQDREEDQKKGLRLWGRDMHIF